MSEITDFNRLKPGNSSTEIVVPELLPPSEDGVFRTLLTHPDAKPVLRDVIASFLQISVAEVDVRNAELPISGIQEKRERFDVNCRTDDGRQICVEMQAEAMKGDNLSTGHRNIKNRAVYNLCDLHASQPGRGVDYAAMLQSYQITFCGYTIFPGHDDRLVSRFCFRDEAGEELSDSVGIVFVELTKLGKVMKKPVKEMTGEELWSLFFIYADKAQHRALLSEVISRKGEIKMASELLASISKDERERANYRSRMIFLRDMEHNMSVVRKEGREEGREEERWKIAKKMLKRNRSTEEIIEDTGLSREEIETLRADVSAEE
jgi:predicted transposase/invertase (TIGR01784 family)